MPKKCLFCPRTADSKEHVWSDWILEDLKPAEPIRVKIGKHTEVYKDDPAVLVNCVCQPCNNGWMSDLENESKPFIYPMLHGSGITLSPAAQKLLTRWAVLKTMVIDSINRKRTPFYTSEERTGFKPPLAFLPVGTSVWLARFSRMGFHAGGTDIWRRVDEVPKAIHACVTTIAVGHLAIQVVTRHTLPRFASRQISIEDNPWTWDISLSQIWPVFGDTRWPPRITFTMRGPNTIARLINRWNIGPDVG